MRILPAVLALSSFATAIAPPVLAQTPPATIGQQYVPAPWWMRDPVIASIGQVRVEITANRAGFNATFQAIDRSAAEASRKAADQVRALSQTLAGYGSDKVRVETTLTTRRPSTNSIGTKRATFATTSAPTRSSAIRPRPRCG